MKRENDPSSELARLRRNNSSMQLIIVVLLTHFVDRLFLSTKDCVPIVSPAVITSSETKVTVVPPPKQGPTLLQSSMVDLAPVANSPRGKMAQREGLEDQLDQFFGSRSNLFFVESGAFDGIAFSNTLWFEQERQWKGLLVEANPKLIRAIEEKSGRTGSKLVKGCLSTSNKDMKVQFKLAGPIGGIAAHMDAQHKRRVHNEMPSNKEWGGELVDVNCFPLNDILAELAVDVVDFWSLDTEGSEVAILQTIDFQRTLFGLLFIESNSPEHRRQVSQFMLSQGFVENKVLSGPLDSAWQHPIYCQKYTCGI